MYGQFILIGDRLALRYAVDPTITSVPGKPGRAARSSTLKPGRR